MPHGVRVLKNESTDVASSDCKIGREYLRQTHSRPVMSTVCLELLITKIKFTFRRFVKQFNITNKSSVFVHTCFILLTNQLIK